ncbi:unnamed protein product [Closterium sp. Naga37s-1]|nr:unnamed protein product [Closterium sp. Naga37s-1]
MGLNLESGELLAVKQVLIPSASTTKDKAQEYIKGLEAEVAVLRNLSHPNIVRYLGTAREEEALNIFLEFVPGGSIASLLNKFGCFTEKVIRMYTRQLMTGLSYLHYNHIMHRDIKGANILVDNRGCIKLADFGASRKLADLATMSGHKSMKGTPYWMAPEVIKQTGHGRPADIWSVACTVIEMATGKPPWSEFLSQVSALFHIAQSKGPPLIPDHLSADAKDFLLRCFHRDPNKRPSAAELLKHPFLTDMPSPMDENLTTPPRSTATTATAAAATTVKAEAAAQGVIGGAEAAAAVTPAKAGTLTSTATPLSPTARGRLQGIGATAATAADSTLNGLREAPLSPTSPPDCWHDTLPGSPSLASPHHHQRSPSNNRPADNADTPTSRLTHHLTPSTSRLTPSSALHSHLTETTPHDTLQTPLDSDSPDPASSASFSHNLTDLTHTTDAGGQGQGQDWQRQGQGQRQEEQQGKGDEGVRMSRANLMSGTSTAWQPGAFSELSDLSFRSDFNPMEEPSHNDPLGSYVTAARGHGGESSACTEDEVTGPLREHVGADSASREDMCSHQSDALSAGGTSSGTVGAVGERGAVGAVGGRGERGEGWGEEGVGGGESGEVEGRRKEEVWEGDRAGGGREGQERGGEDRVAVMVSRGSADGGQLKQGQERKEGQQKLPVEGLSELSDGERLRPGEEVRPAEGLRPSLPQLDLSLAMSHEQGGLGGMEREENETYSEEAVTAARNATVGARGSEARGALDDADGVLAIQQQAGRQAEEQAEQQAAVSSERAGRPPSPSFLKHGGAGGAGHNTPGHTTIPSRPAGLSPSPRRHRESSPARKKRILKESFVLPRDLSPSARMQAGVASPATAAAAAAAASAAGGAGTAAMLATTAATAGPAAVLSSPSTATQSPSPSLPSPSRRSASPSSSSSARRSHHLPSRIIHSISQSAISVPGPVSSPSYHSFEGPLSGKAGEGNRVTRTPSHGSEQRAVGSERSERSESESRGGEGGSGRAPTLSPRPPGIVSSKSGSWVNSSEGDFSGWQHPGSFESFGQEGRVGRQGNGALHRGGRGSVSSSRASVGGGVGGSVVGLGGVGRVLSGGGGVPVGRSGSGGSLFASGVGGVMYPSGGNVLALLHDSTDSFVGQSGDLKRQQWEAELQQELALQREEKRKQMSRSSSNSSAAGGVGASHANSIGSASNVSGSHASAVGSASTSISASASGSREFFGPPGSVSSPRRNPPV